MTATPKKKGDTKGLSTACNVNFSRVIRKNYKFGSLLSKLTQYDSIWRGKIVYQSHNYLESIISRVYCSREFFFFFLGVSYANSRPYSQAFLAVTVETGDKNRHDFFHCMQMSLVMSMRFIFGGDWNDALIVLLLPYVRWSVTFGAEGTVFDACYVPFFVL